jgi:protein phosphatase
MRPDKSKDDTAEIPVGKIFSQSPWHETGSAKVQVDIAALSHPGLVRGSNEDHYLVLRFGRTLEPLLTSLPPHLMTAQAEEVGYGLLVADGVGGAVAGETAARLALSTLVGLILHTPDWILSDEAKDIERVIERMEDRYRRIHAALRDQGLSDTHLVGMGTTMTLTASLGPSALIGHIGDSRAYIFRGGKLHQLTHDHTWVQALVDAGQISQEQAAQHPMRHVLIRSLGGREHYLGGNFQRAWLEDTDQILLCSDGLTNMVDNACIASVLSGAASSKDACHGLVDAALAKGGEDNVTAVLARYHIPAASI